MYIVSVDEKEVYTSMVGPEEGNIGFALRKVSNRINPHAVLFLDNLGLT